MTLGELINCGLVKDEHKICIRMQVGGTKRAITTGKWFQDQILRYMDWKIESISYENGYLWIVTVKTE